MSVLNYLTNYKIIRILLPLQGGSTQLLECVAQVTTAPFFEVVFLSGELPLARLDQQGTCSVTFEVAGSPHSVIATIDCLIDANKLRLQALDFKGFAQKRDYFRVDTEISLTYRRLHQGQSAVSGLVTGPVNLSGGGIYFAVPEDVKATEKLAIELFLGPDAEVNVSVIGLVMRLFVLPRGETGMGIRFVEIEPAARDQLIAFCLTEQRRQLQTRIRILDQN